MKNLSRYKTKHKINSDLYGHFIEHLGNCIYGGLWVGKDSNIPNYKGLRLDVLEAIKKLEPPVLRWPGGCFADQYNWRDGIGPKEQRQKIFNHNWGDIVETNEFGTHEFFDLVEFLGTEAYLNVNVGTGTIKEMYDWIEYITSDSNTIMGRLRKVNGREKPWKLKYVGIGNEAWGCGGSMTPEYYANLYRHYQTFLMNYHDDKIIKIASGPNIDDYNWTKVMMDIAGDTIDLLSLHHYALVTKPGETRPATGFNVSEWYSLLQSAIKMEELIVNHSKIINQYSNKKDIKLVVDEWGAWYTPESENPGFLYQTNTIRDALVASITLNIFNFHSDKVMMANLAQMVNVLQAIIQTKEEKMLLTPTYYIFEMYKDHKEGMLIDLPLFDQKYLSQSASIKNDVVTITVCNYHHKDDFEITYKFLDFNEIEGLILSGNDMDSHNTFEHPDEVVLEKFDKYTQSDDGITLTVPSKSIVSLKIKL